MSDRYGCDDVDLSDMPYADEDGIIHHPGMGDDPRREEREDAAADDEEQTEECPCCGGDGVAWVMATLGGDPDDGQSVECEYCKGTGRIPRETL